MGKDYSVTNGEAAELFNQYKKENYVSSFSDNLIKESFNSIMLIISKVFSVFVGDELRNEMSIERVKKRMPIATVFEEDGTDVYYIVNPEDNSHKIACSTASNKTQFVNICLKNISRDVALSGKSKSSRFTYGCIQLELPNSACNASLYWKPLPEPIVIQGPIQQQPRRKIIVLGRILKTSFSTDLMRGARAMARELGAELDDRRTWNDSKSAYYKQIKDNINIIEKMENKKQIGVLFYFIDLDGDITPSIERLPAGFAKLHAGYDRENSISIKYSDSARQMVQHLISMREGKGGKLPSTVLLPEFDREKLGESHPLVIRQGVYRDEIERHNAQKTNDKKEHEKISLVPVNLNKYDRDYDSTDAKGVREIGKAIKDYGESVYAIFGRSHHLSLEVINLVKKRKSVSGETLHPIHIFGENITTDLLVRLSDKNDPLEAVCSADPYFMGRYIVRAIMKEIEYFEENEQADIYPHKHPNVPTILVKKADVLDDAKLLTLDRLPDVLTKHDVRLDGPEFAWERDWMEKLKFCPHSFGPDFPKRQSE